MPAVALPQTPAADAVHANGGGSEPPPNGRRLVELGPAEALDLLAGVPYGRIVFTLNALPAIRPVNHLIDNGEIIIRTRLTAKVSDAVKVPRDSVVAYEADVLDPITRLGWSVVATGIARTITDPERVARYEQLLHPWVSRIIDTVIGIRPEIVTGFRLTDTEPTD